MVKVLINSHANLNPIKLDDGNTPLLTSLQVVRRDCAQMLLDAGADVTIRNKSGISPLMIASNRGLDSIVITLLAAGEDPLLEDPTNGLSAVDHAALANQKTVAEILKRHIQGIDMSNYIYTICIKCNTCIHTYIHHALPETREAR